MGAFFSFSDGVSNEDGDGGKGYSVSTASEMEWQGEFCQYLLLGWIGLSWA